LAEQDVQVIYLCVKEGSNKDLWQKKVAELDVPTPHFFLDTHLSKEIMSYFELRGYPSHLFFDRKGKYHPDLLHSIRDIDFDKVLSRR
jgi:thioredoxin-related protein